jgi:hypothetical protein
LAHIPTLVVSTSGPGPARFCPGGASPPGGGPRGGASQCFRGRLPPPPTWLKTGLRSCDEAPVCQGELEASRRKGCPDGVTKCVGQGKGSWGWPSGSVMNCLGGLMGRDRAPRGRSNGNLPGRSIDSGLWGARPWLSKMGVPSLRSEPGLCRSTDNWMSSYSATYTSSKTPRVCC